jgi:hypothetical protein
VDNIDFFINKKVTKFRNIAKASRAFFTDVGPAMMFTACIFEFGNKTSSGGDDNGTISLTDEIGSKFKGFTLNTSFVEFR